MNCNQARALFDDYLDSFLIVKERHSLHRHIADCDHCRQLLKLQHTPKQVRLGEARVWKKQFA